MPNVVVVEMVLRKRKRKNEREKLCLGGRNKCYLGVFAVVAASESVTISTGFTMVYTG